MLVKHSETLSLKLRQMYSQQQEWIPGRVCPLTNDDPHISRPDSISQKALCLHFLFADKEKEELLFQKKKPLWGKRPQQIFSSVRNNCECTCDISV